MQLYLNVWKQVYFFLLDKALYLDLLQMCSKLHSLLYIKSLFSLIALRFGSGRK